MEGRREDGEGGKGDTGAWMCRRNGLSEDYFDAIVFRQGGIHGNSWRPVWGVAAAVMPNLGERELGTRLPRRPLV